MPASFTVQSVNPENGKVLLVRARSGKMGYVHVDVPSDVLTMIFGEDVRVGESENERPPTLQRTAPGA